MPKKKASLSPNRQSSIDELMNPSHPIDALKTHPISRVDPETLSRLLAFAKAQANTIRPSTVQRRVPEVAMAIAEEGVRICMSNPEAGLKATWRFVFVLVNESLQWALEDDNRNRQDGYDNPYDTRRMAQAALELAWKLRNSKRIGPAHPRRLQVEEFLHICQIRYQIRFLKAYVWRLAGHTSSKQFEHWQAGRDRPPKSKLGVPGANLKDQEIFNQIVSMSPEGFVQALLSRGILEETQINQL